MATEIVRAYLVAGEEVFNIPIVRTFLANRKEKKMKGNRRALAKLFVEAEGRMTNDHPQDTMVVLRKPEYPKINATTVKCRLTVCPKDCSILDLCIDAQ